MPGKKGRSGRKSWSKEADAKDLWDLSIPVLKHALTSNNTTEAKKIDIAMFLVGKMVPKQMELSGLEGKPIDIVLDFGGDNQNGNAPDKDKTKTV